MRVICEKCRAAYGVEDRLIPASGARTQCPRCAHVQTAKAISNGSTGRTAVAASEATLPSARPLPPVPDAAMPSPFGDEPTQPAASRCNSCGAPLTDVFDQALGTCDACRQKESDLGSGPLPPLPEPPAPAAPSLFTPEPFASFEPTAQDAAPAEPTLPAAPRLGQSAPPRPAAPRRVPSQSVRTATWEDDAPSRRSGRWGWAILLVILVAGGAGAWLHFHPAAVEGPARKAELSKVVAEVSKGLPAPSGTRKALLAHANALRDADRVSSYREAAEAFARVLRTDPSPEVAEGYITSVALSHPKAAERALATRLLDAERAAHPRDPRLDVAEAWIHLARGGEQGRMAAAPLAQAALARGASAGASKLEGPAEAWAELAYGESHLRRSPKLAETAFNRALKADPENRLALLLRGEAEENEGELGAALKDLRQRFAQDPREWPVVRALVDTELAVGDVASARKQLEAVAAATPDEVEPLIALAELGLEVDPTPRAAIAWIRKGLEVPHLSAGQTAILWAQLAAAYRSEDHLTQAQKSATTAIAAWKDGPRGHFELLLVELAQRAPEKAEAQLRALGNALDPSLASFLRGRIALLRGKPRAAAHDFEQAFDSNPRMPAARLWAGAAYAIAGDRTSAQSTLLKMARADPSWPDRGHPLDPYRLSRAELLRGADGHVGALSKGAGDAVPTLLEAVILFHQGDLVGASKGLARVLSADEGNVLAHCYRALVALQHGDVDTARKDAKHAVTLDGQSGLAHEVLGEALYAAKRTSSAQRELKQALALDPSLESAQLLLAEIESSGDPPAARELLERLFALDPQNAEVRAALGRLEVSK